MLSVLASLSRPYAGPTGVRETGGRKGVGEDRSWGKRG
jgi:hypothetical protein